MKNLRKAFLSGALLLLFYSFAAAQQKVVLVAPKQAINYGTRTYTANIRVVGFKKILGTQFTLAWDTTVIRFESVSNFGLALRVDDHFDLTVANKGLLPFAWYNEAIRGINLPDSSTLFSIRFNVVGNPNSTSVINFIDFPTEKEISDTTYTPIGSQFINGQLSIRNTSGTTSVVSNEPERLAITKAYPNPFQDVVNLEFAIQDAGQVDVEISDATGKLVYQQQRFFSSGKQLLTLERNLFPATGAYLIHLRNSTSYSLQQVLLQAP
jgi:hypothetical protein